MDIRILGPLVVDVAGRPVRLPAGRVRTVLASLAVEVNRVVSKDRLIEIAWGGQAPPSVDGQIHNCVSALRQALGRNVIVTEGAGYALRGAPDLVDLHRMRQATERARADRAAGRLAAAADGFRAALALWRGRPFDGIASAVLEAEADRLEIERLAVLEAHVDVELDLGRHADVLPTLIRLTEEHPLREGLRAALMLALYRSGQRSEALAVYRDTSRLLRTELGVEPGERLATLHHRMLSNDADIAAPPPPRPVGRVVMAPPPAQLPAATADFTGRDKQLDQLCAVLAGTGDTSAVVVAAVAGMGGVGKTTLAIEAAHRSRARFPDGQLYANLRGATGAPRTAGQVLVGFLRDLGLPPDAVPEDVDDRAALFRSTLADRRVLVVLDDARDSAQVRPLLPGTSGSAVLITSRARLGTLAGVTRIDLDVFDEAQAHDLLTAVVGAERVAREPEAAQAILARCAGLPLAIRIVAARLLSQPGMCLDDLADRLHGNGLIDELSIEDLAVRVCFQASYDGLEVSAARVFRLLGLVNDHDIGLPASAALVAADEPAVARAMALLVAAHLLDEPTPGRYHYHELIRSYAADLAQRHDDPTERLAAVRRLCEWYLRAVDAATTMTEPQRYRVPLCVDHPPAELFVSIADARRWWETERENLVAATRLAAAHGQHDLAWQLPVAMSYLLSIGSHWDDWLETHHIALAAASADGDRNGEGKVLASMARAEFELGRFDQALAHRTESLAAHRDVGDRLGEGRVLNNIGNDLVYLGRPAEAIEHFRQALTIYEEIGERTSFGITLSNMGDVHRILGDFDAAIEFLTSAIDVYVDTGTRFNEGIALHTLGETYQAMGELDTALDRFTRALEIREEFGNPRGIAVTEHHIGQIHLRRGDDRTAIAHLNRALGIMRSIGHPDLPDVQRDLAAATDGECGR